LRVFSVSGLDVLLEGLDELLLDVPVAEDVVARDARLAAVPKFSPITSGKR
jgi:hypothetical protein